MVHVLFVLSVFLEKTIWWKEWIELKWIWHLAHLNFRFLKSKIQTKYEICWWKYLRWKLTKLKGKAAASLIPTTSIGLSVSLSIFLLSLKLNFTTEFDNLIIYFNQSYRWFLNKNSPGLITAAWVSVSFSWSCLNFIFKIEIWFLFDFWKAGYLLNCRLLMSLSCCWYL